MKKLSLLILLLAGTLSVASAQSGDIMISAGAGLLGPACTNCESLFGGSVAGSYAIVKHIAARAEVGYYTKSEGQYSLNAVTFGAYGEFYVKEAQKGFYVAPNIMYIALKQKYDGDQSFSENNVTFGGELGWAIPIANFRIIPHAGYGTWFEDSKGRITIGAKVGFVLP